MHLAYTVGDTESGPGGSSAAGDSFAAFADIVLQVTA